MKQISLPLQALIAIAVAFVFIASTARAQYKGDEKHVITLDQGAKFIQNFTSNRVAPTTKGGYFGRNIFEKILAQDGCVGIRYYYAAKDDATPTLVLVGVDSTGSDMAQGVIAELTYPCPPWCSSPNQLNK